jgi:medium-chain acyl-[acyl-carrier-protein] hydrolase
MGPDVEVLALQTPARALRLEETPLYLMDEIIAEALDAFDAISDLPFVFYGHSLGAAVAFELTRALRRRGGPQPLHLFVGGARPPHFGPIQPCIHRLPQAEFLKAVQTRYGGVPEAVANEPELMSIFLPALVADFSVYETYQMLAEPPLELPITAFCGDQDRLVTPQVMKEWGIYSDERFDFELLRGDHFFLGPHVDTLTTRIRGVLKKPMAVGVQNSEVGLPATFAEDSAL